MTCSSGKRVNAQQQLFELMWFGRRISPDKGVINSLASSPDGKTLYFAAGGTVWTIALSGGEARMISGE